MKVKLPIALFFKIIRLVAFSLYLNLFWQGAVYSAQNTNEAVNPWFSQEYQSGDQKYKVDFFYEEMKTGEGRPLNCHSCGVKLYYTQSKAISDDWQLLDSMKLIGEVGEWGKLPLISKIEYVRLANQLGFFLLEDHSHEGGVAVSLLLYKKGHWQYVGSVPTDLSFHSNTNDCRNSENNRVSCDFSYKSKMSFKLTKDYPEIILHKTGTDLFQYRNKNYIVEDGREVFRFNGNAYESYQSFNTITERDKELSYINLCRLSYTLCKNNTDVREINPNPYQGKIYLCRDYFGKKDVPDISSIGCF